MIRTAACTRASKRGAARVIVRNRIDHHDFRRDFATRFNLPHQLADGQRFFGVTAELGVIKRGYAIAARLRSGPRCHDGQQSSCRDKDMQTVKDAAPGGLIESVQQERFQEAAVLRLAAANDPID